MLYTLVHDNATELPYFKNEHHDVFFRARDLAIALGFCSTNVSRTISRNVLPQFCFRYDQICHTPARANEASTTYLNESGSYQLIMASKSQAGGAFKSWVLSDALPGLRRAILKDIQLGGMSNEAALHYRVVSFIRKHYPDATLVAGLGELQDTQAKRIDSWRKGYRKGQPDICIVNMHASYRGFSLELKNPRGTGKLSEHQSEALEDLICAGWKVLVSSDYDEILVAIVTYMQGVVFMCPTCQKTFQTRALLRGHDRRCHRKLPDAPPEGTTDQVSIETTKST